LLSKHTGILKELLTHILGVLLGHELKELVVFLDEGDKVFEM
jgi:hypothetical protein